MNDRERVAVVLEPSFGNLLFLNSLVVQFSYLSLFAMDDVIGVVDDTDSDDVILGWVDDFEHLVS